MSRSRRRPGGRPDRAPPPTPRVRERSPGRWLWISAAGVLFFGLVLARPALRSSLDLAEIPGALGEGADARVREKVEQARRAVAADPRSGRIWGRLGTVLYAHERENDAAACFERAAGLEPGEPRWHYLLARLEKTRNPARALEHSEFAVTLAPRYAPARVLRGELLEEAGEVEAARSEYRRAVALDSRAAPAELGLGRLALAAGDPEESLGHLERAAALQPEARSPQAFLAMAHRRLGNREAARRAAKRAGRLDGETLMNDRLMNEMVEESVSAMGYQRRAALAEALGDPTGAESLYRTLLELHPEDTDAHYNLGNLLARLGRTEEAVVRYRRALEIAPDKAEARFNLGNLFLQEGRLDDAERAYRRALEVWPDHTGTLTNLANTLVRQGRMADAAASYRRAVEADPDNPIAHHQLGQVLAREGRLSEAISHFRAALGARPDSGPLSGPVHLDLALALARANDYAAALRHAQAARDAGTEPPAAFGELLRSWMAEPRPPAAEPPMSR